ncbi:MAG: hypothetical protein RIF39_07585 [Cyclobacteriaceae bacterium]
MDNISLTENTQALQGQIESYWFENLNIGLKKTLFHRITVPIKPFDSGLDYVEQPEKTEFVFDWIKFPDKIDLANLNEVTLSSELIPDMETSIYLGSAHNICSVLEMTLTKINQDSFMLKVNMEVDFKSEGVANTEFFNFETELIRTES